MGKLKECVYLSQRMCLNKGEPNTIAPYKCAMVKDLNLWCASTLFRTHLASGSEKMKPASFSWPVMAILSVKTVRMWVSMASQVYNRRAIGCVKHKF